MALDADAVRRLCELDPSGQARLVERVVTAYLQSADRLRAQLDAAERKGDAAGIRMVAHTLKSSSAAVGALHLASICAQAEALARDAGRGAELGNSLQQLRESLDEALVALAGWRASVEASRPDSLG